MIVTGRSSAISTSKIRKITAIKKNRNENGSRAGLLGSKPHSNSELFSPSSICFFYKAFVKIAIVVDKIRETIISVVIIIYLVTVCCSIC